MAAEGAEAEARRGEARGKKRGAFAATVAVADEKITVGYIQYCTGMPMVLVRAWWLTVSPRADSRR